MFSRKRGEENTQRENKKKNYQEILQVVCACVSVYLEYD